MATTAKTIVPDTKAKGQSGSGELARGWVYRIGETIVVIVRIA